MKKLALVLSLVALGGLGLVACEGDDDETTAVDSPKKATLSPERKIEQTGNRWARLFAAADPATCRYMTQPGCEHIKPLSSSFREFFAGATVKDVAIKGTRATARFSNGERVELSWVNGYAVGGIWWIDKVGGDEPDTPRTDPARKSCGDFRLPGGGYPALKVEVVEGNISCGAARRVMKDRYLGRNYGDHSSWSCAGPEGLRVCQKRPGVTVRARFH